MKLTVYVHPESPEKPVADKGLVDGLVVWSKSQPPVALLSVDSNGNEVDIYFEKGGIAHQYRDRTELRRFVPWDMIGYYELKNPDVKKVLA